MVSTLAPSARQNAASFSTAAASTSSGGVKMHQRPTKSAAKPASGPEYSVPATGCAGTKCTPAGKCGAMSRSTAPLTEPTSETVAPRARCGPISSATAPQAPTGTQTMTRSAPATAAALLSTTWSASPSSATRRRVSAERAVATISRTTPCARAARAIEEPIKPTPIKARRLNSGADFVTASCRFRQELSERGDDEVVRLLLADAHAQRVRQLVGAELAQDEPARGEEGVCVLGGASLAIGEMDQQKIGDARRYLEAEFADLPREPGEPARVVLARALLVRVILDRRDAGGDRRRVDVERAANAIDGGDDVGGAEHPAESHGREAVDLGERAGHDDVVVGGDELDAGFVIVAADIFGVSRVEHEQHLRRQAAVQPLDLVERDIRAGRVVRIGEKDDFRLLRHGRQDRIDVCRVIRLRRDHRAGAGAERRDRVN